MKPIILYQRATMKLESLKDLPLLFFRLILAYGFYTPAVMKWSNINGIAEWFASMGIPFPTINAYLAATTEIGAVILLPLGLATRIISIPLMFTMVIAIITVHLNNGFEAGNNGFEIPLYYFLMLFVLVVNGAGKISVDNLISRRINH
ncbi:MAG: DoxX family protein [Bacteroidetes bacterium]|jgi:putative oxidoreductase|nr:DoxX family protein [Bacteroidota bacterium]